MMDVLLLTNRPAPMMPPIEIMVRWRGFKERESSFFPVASAEFDTVISGTSRLDSGHLTLLPWRHAGRRAAGSPGRTACDGMTSREPRAGVRSAFATGRTHVGFEAASRVC